MAILSFLATEVAAPKGVWEGLLGFFGRFITDYAWRIIVFTICLKLVLSPLDFYQKYKMKKNQRITEKLKPEMEKLQKQYANDKQALQQRQMQIQKAEGFSYFSACIPLIVTLVIFLTLFAGMQNISQYTEFKQYVERYDLYTSHYTGLTSLPLSGEEPDSAQSSAQYKDLILSWGGGDRLTQDERESVYNSLSTRQQKAYDAFIASGQSFDSLYASYASLRGKTYFLEGVFKSLTISNTLTAEQQASVLSTVNQRIREGIRDNKIPNGLTLDEFGGFDALYSYYKGEYEQFITAFDKEAADISELKKVAENDASRIVHEDYQTNKTGFLWVKSIWTSDAPWSPAVTDYAKFSKRVTKYTGEKNAGGLDSDVRARLGREDTYNKVMKDILTDPGIKVNGYLIFAFLSVGLSFLSQFITTRQQKKSGQVSTGGGSMKIMMFIMPVITAIFAVVYTAAFALYMITNSLMTLLINLATSAVFTLTEKKNKKQMVTESGVIRYGRRDPNDYVDKKKK